MTSDRPLSAACNLMDAFARRTGLVDGGASSRYLWTDAFAVCNFLELHRRTEDERYLRLALRLVDQVHHTLGRHREDDPRTGWISGLEEERGENHPTRGGLRIGKNLPERKRGEPFAQRLEWERDGQYYHYLTKWMHALNRAGRVTGDGRYNRWAVELAQTAYEAFTRRPSPGAQKRIVWKMSIDLSYPLVSSMGQHDPLDGLITYQELEAAARQTSTRADLSEEIDDLSRMSAGIRLRTDDALGIGGLLSDAHRLAQLMARENLEETALLQRLLDASLESLQAYRKTAPLGQPPRYRLAFRELGLAIGLEGARRLDSLLEEHSGSFETPHLLRASIEDLREYERIGEQVEAFWLDDAHRKTKSWTAHQDINAVMLATSLAPDGYLSI